MELTRSQQVLLFVMGQMAELEERGLVRGGYKMTDDGRSVYQELMDAEFKPTEDELRAASVTVFYEATEFGRTVVSGLPS